MSLRAFSRRWLVSAVLLTALVVSGATLALANLLPSTFEARDGNFIVDTVGNKDWGSNPPNLKIDVDKATGQTDDALGSGAKEDSPTPGVVNGSIPNNK